MLRFIGLLFTGGVIMFLGVSVAVGYVVWHASQDLPDYGVLRQYEPPVMTRVHAADGSLIAEYARERRLYIPINAIPDSVIQAFLSAEDKNFYKHGGIDLEGVARAVIVNISNIMAKRRLVGASTITQQVAKNFLLTRDRTIQRKLKEALLAIRIERTFSKGKILELYLNEIFLGLGSYGVAAASLNYFGKSLRELNISEVAYLAALPKAPNNYNPFRYTKRAIERRNWVIDRMVDNGYVSDKQALEAKARPLTITPRPFGAQLFAADYFAEEVRRELIGIYGEKRVYEGGLSVRTTLNPAMQVMARRALLDGLIGYDRSRGWRGPVARIEIGEDWGRRLGAIEALSDIQPWRLAVVLDVSARQARIGLQPRRLKNGKLDSARDEAVIPLAQAQWARAWGEKGVLGPKIRSMEQVLKVGDVVYAAPVEGKNKAKAASGTWQLMQVPKIAGGIVALDPHTGRVYALVGGFSYAQSEFNRAVQALRQPGSAFKPFVYAAALDNGYTPASVVLDAPIEIRVPNQKVWRPKNYGGKFYGPSTVRLGIEKSRNVMTVRLAQDLGMETVAAYARRFGIYDNLQPVLAMALGAGETTVLKLTAAFGMIANGGKKIRPTLIDRIQDRWGKTILRNDQRPCPDCAPAKWTGQPEPVLPDDREQIIDPHTSYQMTSIMEGVVQRGTGTALRRIARPVAGKTGTTNEEKDAWFIGFTPDLVVGVYVGFDTPTPMGRGATGGRLAAPIVADFMEMALKDKPATPFRVPPGINLIPINSKTGQLAQLGDEDVILEAFKPGTAPTGTRQVLQGDTAGDGTPATGTGGLY